MSQSTPWAILLCQFNDTSQQTIPVARVNQLFTSAGAGTFNALRYFSEMSHGTIDLEGSAVFPVSGGYITVDANVGDYVAPSDPPPPGWQPNITRGQLIATARSAATASGVALSQFFGVVVVFNVAIGITFGGESSAGPFACSDFRWVTHNGMAAHGHEMAHGYGLMHSRREGSLLDYQDPWDIMSSGNTYQAADPDFERRGPGVNAANMRALGWLASNRVWRSTSASFSETVKLRPLHRMDLPGFLAVELPPAGHGLLVEFRLRRDWDLGIPRSAVFVHEYRFGNSYVLSSTTGSLDLGVGQLFERQSTPLEPGIKVQVLDISESAETATVSVEYEGRQPVPGDWYGIPTHVIGGLFSDGGGYAWNGRKFVRVPPWNPMAQTLAHLVEWTEASEIRDLRLRNDVLRNIVERMQTELADLYVKLDPIQVPAPHPKRLAKTAPPSPGNRRTKRPKRRG